MEPLSELQLMLVVLIFIWSGFVRTGFGFGGAALALPFMLLLIDRPLFWLPIIATHLLLMTSITVYRRLWNVDWNFIKSSLLIMIIPKLIGVFGLVSLPNELLVLMVYVITLIYSLSYIFDFSFSSQSKLFDNVLLIFGAYVSGLSLIGAPLISAVYIRHVALNRLRDTLFVLWFILVVIKMSTLIAMDVDMQLRYTLYLLPAVIIGHIIGLKVHDYLIRESGAIFRRLLGGILAAICLLGLLSVR